MKNLIKKMSLACIALAMLSCSDDDNNTPQQQTIADIAAGNPDFSTLVTALNRTGLTAALDGEGQFTVFAPTNAAFDKVDKATLDGLMTDAQKEALQDILQYHVTVSAIPSEQLQDGQSLGMVNGQNVTVSVKNGKIMLNNTATIVASVRASNGWVHVIDGVLLPPKK